MVKKKRIKSLTCLGVKKVQKKVYIHTYLKSNKTNSFISVI